ncbi:GTP-binding protein [Campylobacter coli]|nr:GTP-binding protein [Campylobacter coli]EAJ3772038.1 GTP-binding protein [Campylobacter coli]EAJ4197768.1 GTP-binding protein [Campylobacter coli]EAK1012721.1 GTP-binding protein [Campylobacter coli]EAK4286244.1 GTP-binding protein [Campylobacter coli]
MAKIPVHVVTGFLGSRKTTFLKEILTNQALNDIALVINELGEVSLDHKLVQTDFIEEQTLFLNAGCACCNKREDLQKKFKELLDNFENKGKKPQRVILETSGLANPAPIIFTFQSDVFLANHFELANIITCIDAFEGLNHLQNEEACNQILSSDFLILTKKDLNPHTQSLEEKINTLYPNIQIISKENFNFDMLSSHHKIQREIKNIEIKSHKDDISSITLIFDKAINWNIFSIWLSMLLHEHGSKILRVKGLINTEESYLTNINGVGHLIYHPTHTKISSLNHPSQLVFIAKNLKLDKIKESLENFLRLEQLN